MTRRSQRPKRHRGPARHHAGEPGVDKQPGPRRDQLPGAVEAPHTWYRHAWRFRAASASGSRLLNRAQL